MRIRIRYRAIDRHGKNKIRVITVDPKMFSTMIRHGLSILLNSDDFLSEEITRITLHEVAGLSAGYLSSVGNIGILKATE